MIARAELERPPPVRVTPVHRCACGGSGEHDGPCRCGEAPVGTAGGPAPELVYRSLSGGGRPLEGGVRASMERRFGRDLGSVRLHGGDALSAASAAAIGARAYTVGRDVVFGGDGFDPADRGSRATLAHELAHVLQQGARPWAGEPLEVTAADDPAEHAAESAAQPLAVARQAALAEAPPVEVEFDPANMEAANEDVEVGLPPEPEVETRPGVEPAPRPRYVPPPRSIEEGMARDAARRRALAQIAELERPVATLERGGRAPDFVTTDRIEEGMFSWGNRRYRKRSYHVLDAIESDVANARGEDELGAILRRYTGAVRTDPSGRLPLPQLEPEIIRPLIVPAPQRDLPVWPDNFDPDATRRIAAFTAAVARRGAATSTGSQARPAGVPAFVRILGPGKRRERCLIFPSAPAGVDLDPLGSIYCSWATGTEGMFEWLVVTPEGEWAQFDALIGNTAYECKCGYQSLARGAMSADARRRRFAEWRLSERDEQMRRQSRVCDSCGLGLRYFVSNEEFAAVLNERWGGRPPVIWRYWSECD